MESQNVQSNPSPEMGAYRAPEAQTLPNKTEVLSADPTGTSPATDPKMAVVKPLPTLPSLPAPQSAAKSVAVPASDTNPISASDEDVIEKEWVEKAKKIVAQTKDDPYAQEKEVSKLQADYLKKRYGREIKVSGD
jgi:hypothetical protein